MNEEKQINDLKIPLNFNNPFVTFIFQQKEIDKISYKSTITCFGLGSLVFFIISIAMFVAISKVKYTQIQYYQAGNSNCSFNQNCTVTFNIQEQMTAPIYVMYSLDQFYQNHRRYVQSKSNYQLSGKSISIQDASICTPYITNQQMKVTHSWAGVQLDPNAVASPCGAIAYTFFNDTFSLFYQNGSELVINQDSITWPSDVGSKYRPSSNSNQTQWINPQNQHFINWMRIGGIPNFKKLWGRITSNIPAGGYELNVANNFDLQQWSGDKYFILSTNSSFGGRNYTLPIFILISSILCALGVFLLFRTSRIYVKYIN